MEALCFGVPEEVDLFFDVGVFLFTGRGGESSSDVMIAALPSSSAILASLDLAAPASLAFLALAASFAAFTNAGLVCAALSLYFGAIHI